MTGVRLFVGVAIAGVLLHALVALGVVAPVVVAGSSMAPTYPDGSRLMVDRASLAWRGLERWDAVVARNPDDARQLCVKRVVGLPGERIALREGDVWADGRRVRKPLADQLATRVLVHRGPAAQGSWRPESESDRVVFRYRHGGDGVIRDDLAENAAVTRRLHPIADLMLTVDARWLADAECVLQITRGGQSVRFAVSRSGWRLASPAGRQSSPWPKRDGARLLLSLFDQQVLAAVDGRTLVREPLPAAAGIDRSQRLTVESAGGDVLVERLAVWRDVFYERRPIDRAPAAAGGEWLLAGDRWFLVGDNQAVSLDSRCWRGSPGVPARLLIGRVAPPAGRETP